MDLSKCIPKQRKGPRARRGKQTRAPRGLTANALTLRKVPAAKAPVFPIRRSWSQIIPYNPNLGWFGTSQNIQINYAASQSQISLGGVFTYGPSTPSASELVNLFDQYRIKGITMRFDWTGNAYSPTDLASSDPLLYYCVDYDDSGDASVSDLLQRPGVMTHSFRTNGYEPLIVSLKPKPLRDVASTGLLTGYSPMESAPFIRTAEMTVPHYGLKIACLNAVSATTTTTGYLMATCYIDMEFINVK